MPEDPHTTIRIDWDAEDMFVQKPLSDELSLYLVFDLAEVTPTEGMVMFEEAYAACLDGEEVEEVFNPEMN